MTKNKNIVVSVDEEYTAFALSLILKREKHTVTFIKNCFEALNYIFSRKYTDEKTDLLIIETSSIRINAEEIMNFLTKAQFIIPVLIITGNENEFFFKKKNPEFYLEFIQRPIVPEQFVRKVDLILKKNGKNNE